MGIGMFNKSCSTNYSAIAPNPSPSKWTLLERVEYQYSYVLKVRYDGCTNFEGIKVMVFRGKYIHRDLLDPHFQEGNSSPIARFRPDEQGWELAKTFAMSLEEPETILNGVYDNRLTMRRERYYKGKLESTMDFSESMKNNKFFPWGCFKDIPQHNENKQKEQIKHKL